MIYVLVKDGIVEHVISVDSIDDLTSIYPEHKIIKQVDNETIGWTYDGANFTQPLV